MRRITAMGVAALLAFAGTARSQDSYPNRPIHIVVPSAAGGTTAIGIGNRPGATDARSATPTVGHVKLGRLSRLSNSARPVFRPNPTRYPKEQG